MSEHTPGKLRIGTPPPNGEQTIGTEHGLMVAVATTGAGVPTKGNARRLVACWNACDGVPTDALEQIDGFGKAALPYHQLKAQHKALLAALQRVMDVGCPLTGNPTHAELVEFWEYEKTQGRVEAEDRLFALAAIEAAKA